MSLVSSTIPNFVNGVSQQPYTLRLSSQGGVQENGLSAVSTGLRKRPPTEHLAKILGSPLTDAYLHTIDRDGTEQYVVVITNGDLKVYDLMGVQKTVTFTNGTGYLVPVSGSVDQSFALTTVADYTFVVNKTKTVLASTTLGATRPYEALLNVKLGNYGKTYEVLVNGSVAASYATPDGTSVADSTTLSTEFISGELYADLVAAGLNTAPWSVTKYGAVLHLRNSSTDFTVATQDGFNSTALVAIKGNLQKFSDLPSNPRVNGFTVQITGDQSSGFDNYWVTFDANGVDNNTGVWKESVKPGISVGLDNSTLPHQLVREANGTFTFKRATWDSRKVGDVDSNPHPSFVGRTLNDIFFYQNRLGFLSDESYIQSEAGKYFNVYRTTVNTLLDSDPVDVSAATNKVAILRHAVGFNKSLLLFSTQQQFIVSSDEPMTPKRVPIKPSTDFPINILAKPVAVGRNVYFVTDKGAWSSVREYFVDPGNTTNDAGDVSAHVPKYIPSGVVKIAASQTEDTLALLVGGQRSKLFIYSFYFSGNEKLQSSWSTFTLPTGSSVLHMEFIRSVLYMVVSRSDGVYFEKIDLSAGAAVTGEPYQVALDRKVVIPKASLTYSGGYTRIGTGTIGYVPSGDGWTTVAHGGGTIKAGQLETGVYAVGYVSIPGDYTASDLTLGQKYLFKYSLSTLTIKKPAPGGGSVSDTEGRTQVRRVGFNHADAGYYTVKVTPESRPTYTYVFAGKTLGTSTSMIGTASLETGKFNVPVLSRNTTVDISIESDMPNPVSILSADWEAMYVKRSQSL